MEKRVQCNFVHGQKSKRKYYLKWLEQKSTRSLFLTNDARWELYIISRVNYENE